uniref:Uncharacterized protein n=1 Tax=Candidatus Kentrum sp. DK TaxID=2126562 RepID=A0A450S4Q1_9GAMM|nr:MAG: hypothetical protein BECKDK2373C_GA0170839_10163 [Candidatus Kentron sp. DK]
MNPGSQRPAPTGGGSGEGAAGFGGRGRRREPGRGRRWLAGTRWPRSGARCSGSSRSGAGYWWAERTAAWVSGLFDAVRLAHRYPTLICFYRQVPVGGINGTHPAGGEEGGCAWLYHPAPFVLFDAVRSSPTSYPCPFSQAWGRVGWISGTHPPGGEEGGCVSLIHPTAFVLFDAVRSPPTSYPCPFL